MNTPWSLLYRLATIAECDPRTVRKMLKGEPVRRVVSHRVDRVLAGPEAGRLFASYGFTYSPLSAAGAPKAPEEALKELK